MGFTTKSEKPIVLAILKLPVKINPIPKVTLVPNIRYVMVLIISLYILLFITCINKK